MLIRLVVLSLATVSIGHHINRNMLAASSSRRNTLFSYNFTPSLLIVTKSQFDVPVRHRDSKQSNRSLYQSAHTHSSIGQVAEEPQDNLANGHNADEATKATHKARANEWRGIMVSSR